MNLKAAKADGIAFFTHKATEATWIRHKHTGEALARARDAGIEFIGAYHVVRSISPAEQVDYYLTYLDQVAPWWRTFPGFFHQVDLELWDYDRVSAATGKTFAEALAVAQPKRVVMYASRGQYGDQLATLSPAIPLWNAAYGTNPAVHYPDGYRGDGSLNWRPYSGRSPVFWQYGSRTTIGSQSVCDANAYRGTVNELRALMGVPAPQEEDDMHLVGSGAGDGSIYLAPGNAAPSGRLAAYGLSAPLFDAYKAAGVKIVSLPAGMTVAACPVYDVDPQPWPAGGDAQLVAHTHDGGETGPAVPAP